MKIFDSPAPSAPPLPMGPIWAPITSEIEGDTGPQVGERSPTGSVCSSVSSDHGVIHSSKMGEGMTLRSQSIEDVSLYPKLDKVTPLSSPKERPTIMDRIWNNKTTSEKLLLVAKVASGTLVGAASLLGVASALVFFPIPLAVTVTAVAILISIPNLWGVKFLVDDEMKSESPFQFRKTPPSD